MGVDVVRDEITGPGRRLVLGGSVAAYVASHIPWALAQPVADDDIAPFMALSALLAGRRSLDGAQARRLFAALVADDPDFPAAARSLLDMIEERKLDPMALQQTLDAEKPALAPIPRQVMTAWYLGIVGNGDRARCIAYETALNAETVSDVLRPPSYAFGAYGSWTAKPA